MRVSDIVWRPHNMHYWMRFTEILDQNNDVLLSIYQRPDGRYRISDYRRGAYLFTTEVEDLLDVQAYLFEHPFTTETKQYDH
jgi:hypothetical protein